MHRAPMVARPLQLTGRLSGGEVDGESVTEEGATYRATLEAT
jgi:hypothetical protein